ncbi:MAG: alkaline phosphatase family protein, partial [Oscillospiraceae bacterium]|nr:alkaline phosphatase family protein [Oscillospiraceae bacterium]
ILDAFGAYFLNEFIPTGFLASHKAAELTSVCPSTTVAALTTFRSGLSPIEHGYLGWTSYFKYHDKILQLFSGKEYYTDNSFYDIANLLEYENLKSQIKRANPDIKTLDIPEGGFNFDMPFNEICEKIADVCSRDGQKYIYAYFHEPDKTQHTYGCSAKETLDLIYDFDRSIEKLASKLKDTLLIVTADHGQVDTKTYLISEFPQIEEMLWLPPGRERRNISFYVKDKFKDKFAERFFNTFSTDDFLLYSREDALKNNLFGFGNPHKLVDDFLGDFIAVSINDKCIWYDQNGRFKINIGNHAGFSYDEMMVPLCLICT